MSRRKLNDQQQQAVRVDRNAVVSAGAGSGKTTVLALRFLRLIREGKAGADQILTLTFTRKAAAEMYERIHGHLLDNREDPRVAAQLERFDRAQISTLDSFCSQIVRGDSARFGIPGDYSIDEEQNRLLVKRRALDFLLRRKDHPAMARLLDRNGFSRTWEEFWTALGLGYLGLVNPVPFSTLAEGQFAAARERLISGAALINEHRGVVAGLDPGAGKAVAQLQEILESLEDPAGFIAREEWADLSTALFSLSSIRSPGRVSKDDLVLAKEIIQTLKPVAAEMAGFSDLLENRGYVSGVAQLAEEFQAEIQRAKRQAGSLTFQDVMELAVEILKTNPELRGYYKGQYRYIMIDEFQDNNDLQRQLLYLLAERQDRTDPGVPDPEDLDPGKLYFVGDEKQSIYRFRGADVSVFKGLKDEIGRTGGEHIELNTNYRSEPGLIDFFNQIFPRIMAGADRPFEAEFRPLESRGALLSRPARIQLLLGDRDEEAGGDVLPPKQGEAYRIARMIRDAVEGKTLPVWREGIERPAGYDDFAVLLRSTGSQGYYERFFRVFGIPYEVQDLRSFYLEAPVNDFYVLLETVVYPSDRLAYAALLRSPWVSLSDDSLSALLSAALDPFDPAGLELMVRQEDREAYHRGTELYLWCREQADTLPLPELLEDLWFRRGYRYTLLWEPLYHSYLEYFDYLWTLAAEAEERGLSLAGFLDGIRANLGQFERLKELKVEKKHHPGVKIMTIHASKGLEFPVTIIGDAGSRGRKGQEGAAPFFFTPAWGLTLKLREGKGANPFYEAAREERQAQEEAELKRLLYVALTRSENHLILAGNLPGDKLESQDSLLNLFLQGFGITRAEEIPACLPLAPHLTWLEPVLRSEAGTSGQHRVRRDPAEVSRLYRRMPLREKKFFRREWGVTEWIREQEDRREERPRGELLPPLGCDPLLEEHQWEASFGSLCHLCLEEKLKGWSVPGRKEALLRELPREERDRVLQEAEAVTERFVASSLGREVSRAVKIEPEYPFLMRRAAPEGRQILRGTMDLLVTMTDQVWVVDFKTDRYREPWFHREQLEIYRLAAEALSGLRCRSFLFYLRDGSVEEMDAE